MTTQDFFRARLDCMVDPRHPLVVLTGRLPWAQIEQVLAPHFERKARTACTAIAQQVVLADVDLLQSVAGVVGLRSKGSNDQLGAGAQDQVLHRVGILAARTGLGLVAPPGLN